MPSFDIVKQTSIPNTFRCELLRNKFSIEKKEIIEQFTGKIDYPINWNVGVIVGASGTGKSTIAKQIYGNFNEYQYGDKPIIEEVGVDKECDVVCDVFNKVGFSSPPSWLKPYHVLSNGEKMRVDLANAILSDKEIIVFDEFTSVVDRNIAKIGSFATQKYIRKNDKKFVAITCHYDILDWLEPDWVFCTDDMSFQSGKMSPNIKDHQSKLKSIDANQNYGNCLVNIII